MCVSRANLSAGSAKVLEIYASDLHAAAQPLISGNCQCVYQGDMSSK